MYLSKKKKKKKKNGEHQFRLLGASCPHFSHSSILTFVRLFIRSFIHFYIHSILRIQKLLDLPVEAEITSIKAGHEKRGDEKEREKKTIVN